MNTKDIDPDIVEGLTSLSKLTMGFTQKSKKLKEKDQIIAVLQKELTMSKEAEETTSFQNARLLESLNKFKDLMQKSSTLESEVTKLLEEKRAMEKCLDNQKCLLAKEKEKWAQEKINLINKFQIDLGLCRENNKEEVLQVQNNHQKKNLELQRKLSALTYELSLSKHENQELLSQTKKIWEEKLRRKDEELKTAENELNYWRKKNFSSITNNNVQLQKKLTEDKINNSPDEIISSESQNCSFDLDDPSSEKFPDSEPLTEPNISNSMSEYQIEMVETNPSCSNGVIMNNALITKGRGEFSLSKRSSACRNNLNLQPLLKPKAVVSPKKIKQQFSCAKKKRLFDPKQVPDF